jgi:endoglucanase
MRYPFRIACALMACLGSIGATRPAIAAATNDGILWGVNESGLEFGKGLIAGTNYPIPDPSYYLSRGVKLVRVPFQIVRLQPVPNSPLAPNMVGYLKTIIAQDSAAGAITVLDPHGYGTYPIDNQPQDLLKNPTAQADYVDFMRRLAETFGHGNVAIGLMNEPHTGGDADYAPIWNQAIAAIRQAGFSGVIIVPHAHWSTASDITPATPYAGQITDPDNNWVLELHLYFDPDNSGTYKVPVASADVGVQRLTGAIAWSQQSNIRLFIGETGGPPTQPGLAAYQAVLQDIAANPNVFWGVAVWGGGPWWKPNYPMRLDPLAGVDTPQFTLLGYMLSPQMLYFTRDPAGAAPTVSIQLDGADIAPPVTITALRNGVPQAVPIFAKLSAGPHRIRIVNSGPPGSGPAYIVDSTWKGQPDSDHAYGTITYSYIFDIAVPN